jgi:hypothetical protein
MPGRVATALAYPARDAFLADYRQRTADVRALYTAALGGARRATAHEVA